MLTLFTIFYHTVNKKSRGILDKSYPMVYNSLKGYMLTVLTCKKE